MSDQYSNDDFEKVEPEEDTYQDENITSTSMTGADMPEEDAYTGGNSAQNDLDMFSAAGNGSFGPTSTEPKAPLISFDQPLEPTAPSQPEYSVSGAKADSGEGCWVNNVDPRDAESVEDMAEPNEALPAKLSEPMAQSGSSLGPIDGDIVNEQNKQSDLKESEGGLISDTDSVVSGSSEYSSSGEESDLETSDSESIEDVENIGKDHLNSENETIDTSSLNDTANEQSVQKDSQETNIVAVLSEDSIQAETIIDSVPNDEKETMNSNSETVETNDSSMNKIEDEKGIIEKHSVDAVGLLESLNEEKTLTDTKESLTMNSDVKGEVQTAVTVTDYDNNDDSLNVLGTGKVVSDDLNKEESDASLMDEPAPTLPENSEIQKSNAESVIEKEKCSEEKEVDSLDQGQSSISLGFSENDLSDVLDKLTSEEDIVDNISPVVSDFEKEMNVQHCEDSRESSGSPDAISEDTDSGSEDECSVDSDISGDEGVSGAWNPSPLYSFNAGEDEDDEDDSEPVGYDGVIDNQEKKTDDMDEDNKLNELREDVKDLMEQMESLVKKDDIDESGEDVHLEDDLEGASIEVIGAAETIQSSFKQSDKSKKQQNIDEDELDLPHVHFQSPTNMLFYDPDSPIIERVSAEVQNALIDCDAETKEVEKEAEIPNNETQAELQAEVVKDLKDIYDKLEGSKEESVESDMGGKQASTLESISDPSVFNLYKRKQEDKEDDEQVVLRKKNNRNVDTELHRNTLISERECDSMIIHDLELKESTEEAKRPQLVEENIQMKATSAGSNLESTPDILEKQNEAENDDGTEMKTSTDSMIIHEDDEGDDSDLGDVSESINSINKHTEQSDELHSDIKDEDKLSKDSSVSVHDGQANQNKLVEHMTKENNQNFDHDNICDSDTESIEESSPFNISHNNTIIEAHTVNDDSNTPELKSEVSISEQSKVKSAVIGTELAESGQMTQSPNIDTTAETLETNKGDASTQDVSKQTISTKKDKGATWDMIVKVLDQVLDLIYWRDVKKTGVVFGSMMFILLSLSLCSLMSVLAYLSLAILTVTLSFRIYKNVMQAVQKTNEGHPFKNLLQMDIELNEDVVKNAADKIAGNINNCAKELRRLYLVEDYVDTLKFGLLLWLLTYIGGWFNGMTLIILLVVSIFTLPKVYETYKVPIDQNVNLVRGQLNNIMAQVSAKIPFPKKKAKVN